MTRTGIRSNLALVVPFHNEERYLPVLIESLRRQDNTDVPIVFVDNGSTDRSAILVQQCDEASTGRWFCISQERIGKRYAMLHGAVFSRERFGAGYVGLLDADSYFADPRWVSTADAIVQRSARTLGYTISPFRYVGMAHLPRFAIAYGAYEKVLWQLMDVVGWLANGLAFVCPVDALVRYFERAAITTEIDLRLSLLALSEGLKPEINPAIVFTSARRIVVNRRNFSAWCFYERQFYSHKDINDARKLNLNTPGLVDDLPPDMIAWFFSRRALKLTCRHLVPFLLFSADPSVPERMVAFFGAGIRTRMTQLLSENNWDADDLLTDRFQEMVVRLECHPLSTLVAGQLAERMRNHYERRQIDPTSNFGTTDTPRSSRG